MALPRKHKDLMLFNEGGAYRGEIASVTLPKLGRKFDDWKGGGMDAAVKIDLGGDYAISNGPPAARSATSSPSTASR